MGQAFHGQAARAVVLDNLRAGLFNNFSLNLYTNSVTWDGSDVTVASMVAPTFTGAGIISGLNWSSSYVLTGLTDIYMTIANQTWTCTADGSANIILGYYIYSGALSTYVIYGQAFASSRTIQFNGDALTLVLTYPLYNDSDADQH